uniref:Uncharacterized protein LOC8269523 n=1 Tax=Rhizophora mucronata TaxID=61149 RepID=A0A2P2L984_RHIMU
MVPNDDYEVLMEQVRKTVHVLQPCEKAIEFQI